MSAAGRQGSFDSGYTELLDSSHQLMQQAAALAPTASSGAVEQRWVPYRHTNGVAIYHHKEPAAASCCLWGSGQVRRRGTASSGCGARAPHSTQSLPSERTLTRALLWCPPQGAADEPPGSEYMASSIVKGCPDECLSVLVDPSSHTTILGPASRIQLLENGPERQVQAPGAHARTPRRAGSSVRVAPSCLHDMHAAASTDERCRAGLLSTLLLPLLLVCVLQVLRLIVEATGMARRLCAPREVIVERLFKR
jgi:hypothetical protein